MKELNQHIADLDKDFEPLVSCLLVGQIHTVMQLKYCLLPFQYSLQSNSKHACL